MKSDDKFLLLIKDFIKSLAISLIVVFLITQFLVRPVRVEGKSMFPTLENDDVGFSNIIGFKTSELKRFDIVVVRLEDENKYIVKRVIGLPGETIRYVDDVLYVDGVATPEPFLDTEYVKRFRENGDRFTSNVMDVEIGADEYFLLGDNRIHSTDSREYGNFKHDNIRSKGVFVIFPISDFGVKGW